MAGGFRNLNVDLIGSLPSLTAKGTQKAWFDGGERVCAPEVTLARVRAHAPTMGITRLADITGLDRIGLPVAQAIRPMSRSLTVKQGKGRTLDAALASAAMEATEAWHGENIPRDAFGPIPRGVAAVDLVAVSCGQADKNAQDPLMDWCVGMDLLGDRPTAVPMDLVSLDFTQPKQCAALQKSSNGLASGNTLAEATAAALFEVIERDCIADFDVLPLEARNQRRLGCAAINGYDCADLEELIVEAGLVLEAWDITNDIGIPAFKAAIFDIGVLQSAAAGKRIPLPQHGFGCHLNPTIALSRAITEAAQSRLVLISGARDDLTPDDYCPAEAGNLPRFLIAQALSRLRTTQTELHRNGSCETSEADVLRILGQLETAGFRAVVLCDLTKDEIGIPVVRAVVPGLGRISTGDRGEQGYRRLEMAELCGANG